MAVTTQQDITQYYVVLGLSCGATIEQIKQARNLLAREWHPDRFPSDSEKMQAEEPFVVQSFSGLIRVKYRSVMFFPIDFRAISQ